MCKGSKKTKLENHANVAVGPQKRIKKRDYETDPDDLTQLSSVYTSEVTNSAASTTISANLASAQLQYLDFLNPSQYFHSGNVIPNTLMYNFFNSSDVNSMAQLPLFQNNPTSYGYTNTNSYLPMNPQSICDNRHVFPADPRNKGFPSMNL